MTRRIWVQTGASFGKEPAFWSDYERAMRRHVQEVARLGTVVVVYGGEIATPPGIALYHASWHIIETEFIKSAIRAEQEGYDAWVCVMSIDPAFHEVREVVDIPVVFNCHSSFHTASLLTDKYSFFPINESHMHRAIALAKEYGLAEHLVPGGCLNVPYEIFQDMFKNPKPLLDVFTREARKAIERGANMFALAMGNPFNIFLVEQGVKEFDGVPVLDSCGNLVRVAELMLDLKEVGVTRSKRGLYIAPSKEELAAIRGLYV